MFLSTTADRWSCLKHCKLQQRRQAIPEEPLGYCQIETLERSPEIDVLDWVQLKLSWKFYRVLFNPSCNPSFFVSTCIEIYFFVGIHGVPCPHRHQVASAGISWHQVARSWISQCPTEVRTIQKAVVKMQASSDDRQHLHSFSSSQFNNLI